MSDGIRIIRFDDQRDTPWKNGGGVTCELAMFPRDAGHTDFDWRISRARISQDGPFSEFPGVERTMCILDGEGLALDVAGSGTMVLGTRSPPFPFGADVPVQARLGAGAITNLNVMTRRNAWRHRMTRLESSATVQPMAGTCALAVLAWGGGAGVEAGERSETLGAGDLAVVDAPSAALRISPESGARAYVVELARG